MSTPTDDELKDAASTSIEKILETGKSITVGPNGRSVERVSIKEALEARNEIERQEARFSRAPIKHA